MSAANLGMNESPFPWSSGLNRSQLTIVKLSSLRTQLGPRAFNTATHVTLEFAGHRVAAAIELQSAPGLIRANRRRFLVCPRCQTRGNVVGCHVEYGWSCPTCGRWSGRRLRRN